MKKQRYLMHVGRSKMDGAKVGSGRYPLGSGKNPYHHGKLEPKMIKEGSHLYKTVIERPGVRNSEINKWVDYALRNSKGTYLSTNTHDAEKWLNYFDDYAEGAVSLKFKNKKPILVMSSKDAAHVYVNKILKDTKLGEDTLKDIKANKEQWIRGWLDSTKPKYKIKDSENIEKVLKENTKRGKFVRELTSSITLRDALWGLNNKASTEYLNALLNTKYDAVEDAFGRDVAIDPIVLIRKGNKYIKNYKNKKSKLSYYSIK